MDSKRKLELQDEIGWRHFLKGLVSHERRALMDKLTSKKNWKTTMSVVVVALWKILSVMWRERNNYIAANARYCIQIQNHNNKLNMHIVYA